MVERCGGSNSHALKIAHFDIWLPNICFKEDDTPVLIDLDRSVAENTFSTREDIDVLRTQYNNSEMYYVNAADDPDDYIYKLDYKQLAIMFLDLVNNDNNDNNMEYNNEPTNLQSSHPFLQELYKGNFNEQLFERFLSDPTTI